jgi:hypothetical protein
MNKEESHLLELIERAEALVDAWRLEVTVKTIAQIVVSYRDQLTNLVYDVFNGNSDPVDFRRAMKALLREDAPQAFEEGMREGGILDPDDDDQAAMTEKVNDWLGEQVQYVNDFAKAIGEAAKDKTQRQVILDRVVLWVDAMRNLGELGRAYAMGNVKATWQLGDRATHTSDCIALSKRPAHRVSWWMERGYTPPIHLGCGCGLIDDKTGETIMGEG